MWSLDTLFPDGRLSAKTEQNIQNTLSGHHNNMYTEALDKCLTKGSIDTINHGAWKAFDREGNLVDVPVRPLNASTSEY